MKITPLKPHETRENGLYKFKDLSLPSSFSLFEHLLISLPPNTKGGNHSHPRREILFAPQPGIYFFWLQDEVLHKHPMFENGIAYLFEIPPHTPHAVHNTSDFPILILEWADAPQTDVTRHTLI